MAEYDEYKVGRCCECDDETLYRNMGNPDYIDTKCKKCGGRIYIDLLDIIKIPKYKKIKDVG